MTSKDRLEASGRIEALRRKLDEQGLDGYVVPRFDEHQGEYCAPHDNRLAFVTGFTGSAGVAIVMRDRAAIFVDGRYQVQVRQEIDADSFAIEHFYDAPLKDWLRKNLRKGERVGFNSMLLPSTWDMDCGQSVVAAGAEWVAVTDDLVDAIWSDQPERPLGNVMALSRDYAGESVADKKRRIGQMLAEQGADVLIEAQPDNIAWFLNVRGRDIAFNPMPQSFMIADRDGRVEWLVDHRKLPNDLSDFELDGVTMSEPEVLLDRVRTAAAGRVALVDAGFAPSAVAHATREAGGSVRLLRSPITLAKMLKNPVELQGFRDCHRHDGAAWIRFFAWLEANAAKREKDGRPVTELEAEDRILALRQMEETFVEPSFRSISAAAGHAAMCHYAASAKSDAPITSQGIYLLDSGGQYFTGTTDATRTTAIGAVSDEVRRTYTAVLKGLISMVSLKFPKGTYGHHLDAFARRPLWDLGLDYDHGTGHGVGHFLSVHEQPQRFDRRVNEIELRPGMVTTIEPGYYKAGEYGIRIENQVEVIDDGDGFMSFRSLTLVPIDLRLADISLLSETERQWIDTYHWRVAKTMEGVFDPETAAWLAARTAPIAS
ncbi:MULTISPECIES: aminopeptidase P family protein [Ensifer]|jgi:Xaa-Pro aminopeptidase|uniref:M24 family metallopeptidase n=2 Tax=Ensifer TaxID=106591 RepID=A0AAW4FMB3_9HYPH|nr:MULTISPECIES: aminopeptidase P family protein [Ensifer]AHK45614.1 aminopeptidase P [Ensifer adhaerens OV14]KQU72539.1 X-Pro aminopeptidase [Ensifer sp. Root31]KQW56781.1 X-Pro aminopeptidase [Ensifer sp. Root127]KQW60411.1 X-Pro aminopeptidase [Ensifer sp. Root1252]KRC77706.1 X-Pro aminopeptidase [Ensifer sp. Root231]